MLNRTEMETGTGEDGVNRELMTKDKRFLLMAYRSMSVQDQQKLLRFAEALALSHDPYEDG
jgi:hypothetical protein